MRIPSGVTDQYIYFVAVDATDFTTRETGLSSFTVYRSRDGGVAAAFTTPTINETDATNMPGVSELLLDEDMTIGTGNDSEEMVFHITATGMAPVTRTIELYRSKITAGQTVTASGGNVNSAVQTIAANAITASAIAANAIGASELATDAANEIGTAVWATATRTLTAATNITSTGGTTVPQTGDSFARIGAAGAGLTAVPWNASWDAEVQSECDDAIAARFTFTVAGQVDANAQYWNDVVISTALETSADMADAVWDEAQSAHTTAGSFGAIATETAAIQAVTDQFVFTVAGNVDANTQYINDAAVVGDGNATPWDGA